jgi:hypothetical protein
MKELVAVYMLIAYVAGVVALGAGVWWLLSRLIGVAAAYVLVGLALPAVLYGSAGWIDRIERWWVDR